MRYNILFLLALLLLGNSSGLFAQKLRFHDNYPLAAPDNSPADLEPELEMSLKAIAGGCKLADDPNTLAKKEDPEAYTKDDYKKSIDEIIVYATEIAGKVSSQKDKVELLKKVSKSVKGGKFADALNLLMQAKVDTKEDIEGIFFIWSNYLFEKKQEVPWLKPMNLKTTRSYRIMLHFVSNNFDRPFGAQAELGGVLADAAQALSNCLESPKELSWQGEGKITMKKEDELRRLASDIAYYEWRMHDKINGRRSAKIDRTLVIKLKQSLYDLVTSLERAKADWYTEPQHGENIQILYNLSAAGGWRVDGSNAMKGEAKEKGKLNEELPTRRLY
jgi:hypothetical protein